MASLIGRVARLARTPQGRRAIERARAAAADPRNKERAADLLERAKTEVASRRGRSH